MGDLEAPSEREGDGAKEEDDTRGSTIPCSPLMTGEMSILVERDGDVGDVGDVEEEPGE